MAQKQTEEKGKEEKIKEKGKEEKNEKEGELSLLVKLHKKNIFLYLLIVSFILFIISRSPIFAILSGVFLVLLFIIDIIVGTSEHGIFTEIKELIIAAIAAIVFFFILMIVLNTPAPLSAIVSCSLLPHYERGDMIVLQGVKGEDINAPTVELTPEEFNSIYGKKQECGTVGVIEYICSKCTRISSKTKEFLFDTLCVREIKVKGQTFYENFSNDVVVYSPILLTNQPWGGDIIHRVFLKIKVGDKYFFLTKGDNNDAFDTSIFYITDEAHLKGRVLLRIPLLGYFKLFLSGTIQDPQFFFDPKGCEMIYAHNA